MSKKLAFISDHASPLVTPGSVDAGGQNVYVAQLARYVASDYEVDIFTRWEDPFQQQVIQWKKGIRIIHIKAGPIRHIPKEQLLPYMGEFSENMIRFIEQEDIAYRMIHAHFFMSAMVAMELKQKLSIPYVVTYHALGKVRLLHQKDQDRFPAERLAIEEETAANADRVIAECPQDKEDLCGLYTLDERKVKIIPCGFCPAEFYPLNQAMARNYLKLPATEKIILQLGRIVPRKGIDNVIRSLAFLKKLKNNVRLLIVGGESDTPDPQKCPEIARLQAIAHEAGVSSRVTFTGRRDRTMLKYYYSAADVFTTTPWYEPFGITPLESMACGTPVIGSDVGGIKYSVKDGETGLLVPPKDPAALGFALDYLLSDPDRIANMQAKAIKRVHHLFSWNKIADMMTAVYEEIMEGSLSGLKKRSPVYAMHRSAQWENYRNEKAAT